MTLTYYQDKQKNAAERLQKLLTLPVQSFEQDGDRFDPWDIFDNAVYGSYSSDFDDVAILTLDNIINKRWGGHNGETVAHEMFRELLCCAYLCDYGTSPRGCFPTLEAEQLFPSLLERWKEYREKEWAE